MIIDFVIVNHVLEHVDDEKAIKELSRILAPKGILLLTVPEIASWEKTYEIDRKLTEKEKELHYGQYDHLRYYGGDFIARINSFSEIKHLSTFIASGEDVIKFGLNRGEKYYVFKK